MNLLGRLLRRATGGSECPHLAAIRDVTPRTAGCEECLETGQGWVALHLCLTCGHVGCCVSSPGAHAKKHYQKTGHPIIQSVERRWRWCYPDKRYV